ncbi:hypothetical protein F5Y14DRAFT_442882 [Nemania sp. NC0429]|nr:hypothetical protein F5Y14DRAFT_442882 [Nemania sp. NC0429]
MSTYQPPSVAEELSVVGDVSVQHQEDDGDEVTNTQWKGKGKAVASLDTEEEEAEEAPATPGTPSESQPVDWTLYEPPEGLSYTGDVESDMVMRIVQESIDRVQTRIREEAERKSAAETARQKKEEEKANMSEKEVVTQPESNGGPSDDASAARVDENEAESGGHNELPSTNPQPDRRTSSVDGPGSGSGSFISDLPKRPKKRTLMRLFRKFNGGPEHGESSTTGAIRQGLLAHLSNVELVAYGARKRLVIDMTRKSMGEDASATPSVQEPKVECVSCLDDFDPKDTVRVPCHNYCRPCFARLVASACQNEQHWPPKCCLNTIPEGTVLANVGAAARTKYRARAAEWDLPVADRVYCSQPKCSLFIPPGAVARGSTVAECRGGHMTCTMCRNAAHAGADACPQDRELLRTNELAEEEGWQRCHGCGAYVEHREACQHMTCRCGTQFCYVCGAPWRTCECSMEQLRALKALADQRRVRRVEREAQEEAAAQEAIRLVAEFEREEALKAELLRQEQARVAREKRERELEEHIRREGERRRAVAAKFEALRGALVDLHATQRDMVRREGDERERRLREKGEAVFGRLRETHEAEREARRVKAEAKIAKRDAKLRSEYEARTAEERRIEAAYEADLKAFWGARRGGEEEVRTAMDGLRRKMDDGFNEWKKWANHELEVYRYHVREEQTIGDEMMEEKERRLRERAREAARALVRQRLADNRWVAEVMTEREGLLEELEVEEMDDGEDIDTWFAESALEEDELSMLPITYPSYMI